MAQDSYFVERINQFHKNVYQKVLRSNPYASVVPMSAFDLTEGRTPIVRTLTHELPTSYPTAMTKVEVSNGTLDPYCDPSAVTVKRGEITRTFDLYSAAFDTDTICVSDLKRAEDAARSVAAFERALTEYLKVWHADYARVKNISMVNNKGFTNSATVLGSDADNYDADFTAASLPTHDLGWDHLDQLYWELVRTAGEEAAIGTTPDNQLVFPLFAGPGIIRRLFSDNDVKQEVRYFDPKSNLKALGFNGAVRGFLPVVDQYALRFGDVVDDSPSGADTSGIINSAAELVVANLIYPSINENATTGRKHSFNPDFRTIARGGKAEYEVVTVLGPQVYENKFEAINPSTFSKAGFAQPSSYIGEFEWINNKTFRGSNDRGNHGYYRADVRIASKPIYPENGWSILTLATDI